MTPLYILAGKYFDFGNGRQVPALLVKIKKPDIFAWEVDMKVKLTRMVDLDLLLNFG